MPGRTKNANLSLLRRRQIVELVLEQKHSMAKVARKIGLTISMVYLVIKKYKKYGQIYLHQDPEAPKSSESQVKIQPQLSAAQYYRAEAQLALFQEFQRSNSLANYNYYLLQWPFFYL